MEVYPRGKSSPSVSMDTDVSYDPFQQLPYAKSRAKGAEEAMEPALMEMNRLVNVWDG